MNPYRALNKRMIPRTSMDARIDREFAEVRGALRLHSWMLAYIVTLLTGIALKLFT